jgi:hypothetical protein
MSVQVGLGRVGEGMQPSEASVPASPGRFRLGRLIPIVLALYLTPALLLVLLVGGVGMVVQAAVRAVSSDLSEG